MGTLSHTTMRSPTRTVLAAFGLTVLTSAHGLLTTASQNADGGYNYNVATVPLLAEVLKLSFSLFLLQRETRHARRHDQPVKMTINAKSVSLYAFPSLIFLAHHSIAFPALQYLDPATFQIMGNLKIVTTGLLSYVFLGRSLTRLRWCALFLVTVGATTSQLQSPFNRDGGGGEGGDDRAGPGEKDGAARGAFSSFTAPWQGYALGLADACCSAAGAVYTEFVMKRNDDIIHWQNVQMYVFGLIFNVVRLTAEDVIAGTTGWERGWAGPGGKLGGGGGGGPGVRGLGETLGSWSSPGVGAGTLGGAVDRGGGGRGAVGAYGIDGEGMPVGGGVGRPTSGSGPWFTHVFDGHDVVSTLVVLNLACAGLLISYVLKFVDAIAKVFATSMAMFITPLLSYALFHNSLSLPMYLGVFTAACGVNMYYMTPRDLIGHDQVLAGDPDLARRELTVAEKQ